LKDDDGIFKGFPEWIGIKDHPGTLWDGPGFIEEKIIV
jgi:hypothetical protein